MDSSKIDKETSEHSKRSEPKRGRKKKHNFLRLRTLIWYLCVRYKSQMSDGDLDLEIVPKHSSREDRDHIDRLRIFETLRRSGASISNGKHAKRSYKLLDLVEELPNLEGSQALYEAPFWEYVIKPLPTLKVVREELIKMINHLELHEIKEYKDSSNVTDDELSEIAALLNKGGYKHHTDGSKDFASEDVADVLGGSIKTDQRGQYDDLLYSFASTKTFNPLVQEELDLKLLKRYFDFLHLSIVYYQYSMLTANLHAAMAASDWIKHLLGLLVNESIIGLDGPQAKEILKLLGLYTYGLIFDAKTLSKQDLNTIFSGITGEFDRENQELPLVKFIHAL